MEEKKIPWPDWEIVRLLGHGSFGEVYEIQRNNFGNIEHAALKVITIPQSKSDIDELYNDGYDSESITARFQSYLESIVKEYSLMTEMKGHGNIVYCDDLKYIQHDDGIGWDIYIKMELLTPLVKSLSQTISDDQVIRLGTDICNALMLCKSKNIVHRDIKPQNIFVSQDGSYKLGDFGVAKTAERTTSGTKVGTYKYMAPEVYKGERYGAGADIYSLGLVMYWMLNERRTPFLPLPQQTPTATMEDDARQRRFKGEQLPAPAHGSEELKRIVLRACAYDPKERYHSAAEMREDLLQINDRTEGTAGMFFDREEKERQRRIQEEKAHREREQRAREQAEEQRRQEEARRRKEEEERQKAEREAEQIRKQREDNEKRKKNIIIAVAACICLLIAMIAAFIPKKGSEEDDNISVQKKVPVDKQVLAQVYQAYIPILENALEENRAVYSDGDNLCKAAMEDLDNDGIQELIVTNLYGNDLSYGEANVVFSVYDYENEKLQVHIDHQDYGDFGSAGLDSYVTIIHRNGRPMIMTYNEIGETSGHDNYMPSRHGTAVIYDCTTYLPAHVYRIDREESEQVVFSVDNQEVSKSKIIKELAQYDDLKENWDESFIMLQFPTDEVMAPVTSWLDELYKNPIVEKDAIPKQGANIYEESREVEPEWGGFDINVSVQLRVDIPDGATDIKWTTSNVTPNVILWVSGETLGSDNSSYRVINSTIESTNTGYLTFWMHQYSQNRTNFADEWQKNYVSDGTIEKYYADIKLSYVYDGDAYESVYYFEQQVRSTKTSIANSDMPEQSSKLNHTIAAGAYHSVYIRPDGTVGGAGRETDDRRDVSGWSNIISLEASTNTVGLRSDGTVVATGKNGYGQCDVGSWKDIVDIAVNVQHTVGLMSNGQVVAKGNNKLGRCNVSDWTDIVDIAAGEKTTFGLKSNGTVVAVGSNSSGQQNISGWSNITAISSIYRHVVGLKKDGTVVAAGNNSFGQCELSGWRDIVQVSAGHDFTVGLRSDGTVVAAGSNDHGQCNVGHWTDIVEISAGQYHVIGKRSDGTYVTAGSNGYGQCDL